MENKIKKVEVRSNKNIKYQYGEKKAWNDIEPGDMIYGILFLINHRFYIHLVDVNT